MARTPTWSEAGDVSPEGQRVDVHNLDLTWLSTLVWQQRTVLGLAVRYMDYRDTAAVDFRGSSEMVSL